MKIYIVIGCYDYEGGDCWSIRWFLSKDKGEEYGEQLVKNRKYDFYEILEGEEDVSLY